MCYGVPITRHSAITTRSVRLDMQTHVGQVVEDRLEGGGRCDQGREGYAEKEGGRVRVVPI